MNVPRPAGLRLETRARSSRPPRPPFGLPAWSDDASALAVIVDASTCDVEDPAQVAAQLPAPSTLAPGTRVFVLAAASRGGGLFRRLIGRTVSIPRVVRCTALLARGYTSVGAGVDDISRQDLAWGSSSQPAPPARD
jgi:hypothetical protein